MKNVVITGMSAMSALGINQEDHLKQHSQGLSGIREKMESNSSFPKRAGWVPEFRTKDYIKDFKSTRFMTRQVILGLCAANMAIRNGGFSEEDIAQNPENFGVIFGAGMVQSIVSSKDIFLKCLDAEGHIDYNELGVSGFRNIPPLWILPRLPNTTAGQISIQNTLRSVNYSVVNGVASGMISIGEAMEHIMDGRARCIVCGGSEWDPMVDFIASLSERGIASVSTHASRSFSSMADGILCSEGSAAFLLEDREDADRRHAKCIAEVAGYASLYAPKVLQSSSSAESTAIYERCMRAALEKAGLNPDDVDLVHATGNGIATIDFNEARAIRSVFGTKTPVSSSMSYTGNTLAASGALNVFYAAMQMENSYLAPIPTSDSLVLEEELNYVREPRHQQLRHVICNSFDYQGNAVSLVLKKGERA